MEFPLLGQLKGGCSLFAILADKTRTMMNELEKNTARNY
jgi:hypothetical protein